jgi:hypothetical protein
MNIRYTSVVALAMALSTMPAVAQNTNTNGSVSGSDATANSGSASGASSDNTNTNGQTQGQSMNGNIGRSESNSSSNSGAVSGSASDSRSASNQNQGQALDNRNSNTANVGQLASNSQGVSVSNTFISTPLKRTYVGTNNAVPLAASSSFSSDYCGGTASGGASAAPIGISIGGSAPTFDKSCQSLRRAEKFGMAAANYQNMQQPEMAMKLMSLMVWSICTADSSGPKADKSTATACGQVLQMGSVSPPSGQFSVPPSPAPAAVTPMETAKPNTEPATPTTDTYSTGYPQREKTPRGEANTNNNQALAASQPRMP